MRNKIHDIKKRKKNKQNKTNKAKNIFKYFTDNPRVKWSSNNSHCDKSYMVYSHYIELHLCCPQYY